MTSNSGDEDERSRRLESGRDARVGAVENAAGPRHGAAAVALRSSEDRRSFLVRFDEMLAPLTDPEALRVLGERLGVDRAQHWEPEGDGEHLLARSAYERGLTRFPARFRVGDFGRHLREAVPAGQMSSSSDVDADPHLGATAVAAYRALGVRAFVVVPVVKAGRLIVVLGLYRRDAHEWRDDELDLARETIERTWAVVERARVELALRATEARARLALGAAGMGSFVWHPEVGRGEPDQRMRALFEMPAEGPVDLGFALARRIHPDDRARFTAAVSRSLEAASGALHEELRLVLDDGRERWVTLVAQTVCDGAPPRPARMAGVAVDITARRAVEERAAAIAARDAFIVRLADRLRALTDPVAIQADAAAVLGEQIGADRAFYAEVHAEDIAVIQAEHLARGVSSAVGRHRLHTFGAVAARALAAGRTLVHADVAGAQELTASERETYRLLGVAALVKVPLVKNGRFTAFLAIHQSRPRAWTRDELALIEETAERTWATVERARVEGELRRSEERTRELLVDANTARVLAESANRSKDEFLTTLSHELRTPLAAILLWAGALRSGAVPVSELSRAVAAIDESAQSQSRLIEDLLDLSRLASGKLSLVVAPADVNRVIRQAVDMVTPTMAAKKLRFTDGSAVDLGAAVLDASRLKQILGNLLANAVKFTPTGGHVDLRASRVAHALEVEVTDDGEGFAAELAPFLFERFWQADMGETRQHMGLGIGLALAKQLATLHGGTIEAHSEGLGRGATFRVRIPWVVAGDDEVDERRSSLPTDQRPLAGLVVLLVEDDAHTREAMRWTLAQAGATVVAVGTCAEALDALDADPPADVVVSDLGLPVMSGYELIEQIVERRRARGMSAPPSLAVSAHARDTDRLRALTSGFDMYLPKPVTSERLIEAVTDLRDVVRAEHPSR